VSPNAPAPPADVKKPLVLVGAGEFAAIAYEYFTCDSDYEVIAFAVEAGHEPETVPAPLPVLTLDELRERHPPGSVRVHVAVTYTKLNSVRMRLFQTLKAWGYGFANFISPHAFVWRNVVLGENVFIFENNVVQPFCTIGDAVVLWSGNHIGHRTRIADGVYVSSHVVISGYCSIGARSFIGVNASFADHVELAEDCFVAMGACVTRSALEPNRLIKGWPAEITTVPAKRLMKV
jgi:sugar O-acyltransferase (sialic acid O-acetyltransferase NeuD family)